MQSILENNYDNFIKNGNENFQKSISKSAFESVVKQISGSLKVGYSSEYLTSLNQNGMSVYLWKISYIGSNENTLAKLTLFENKVAGFWLQ